MTSLSLRPDVPDDPEPRRGPGRGPLVLLTLLLVAGLGGLGLFAWRGRQRTISLEQQVANLNTRTVQAEATAQKAMERAVAAETAARAAAEGRQVAEVRTADALKQAEAAQQEATTANEAAARAQAEAQRIRAQAEAEVNRLQAALGQIAQTRRTALGLVMSLGGDHLKFEFDKADLRPQDRELLSRVAGILMTSHDYTISVNGHTDDVGTDAYNQKLSERRAEAVRDYLVQAGLPPAILTVHGYGKSLPVVRGTSEAARAKNRRVELGLVNTQIRYGKSPAS